MLGVALFIAGLIVFDLLALRFGVHSWRERGRNAWW
jgi:hypothetical protein